MFTNLHFFGFSAVFSNGFPHFESYCISGVQDSDVVAIAIQKMFDVTADIEELFTTLENLTGLDYIGLRDCQGSDAYSLVFQKGKTGSVACDVYDGVFLCCSLSHEVSWMRS